MSTESCRVPAPIGLPFLSWLLLSLIFFAAVAARASALSNPPLVAVQGGGAGSVPRFDVRTAVDAYLAKVPAQQRARTDAYFEGGYWLLLWNFLAVALVAWISLRFRWSARMRDLAERITSFKALQAAVYWVQFVLLAAIITSPLTIYEDFLREHKYDLSNQTFPEWIQDQAIGMAVVAMLGALLLATLFGLARRLGNTWWVGGAMVSGVFLALIALIAPVFISPLFNKFTRLEDPRIRDPILSLARANGIPATEVFEFDTSRQSNRVSANVSGLAGTTRVSLNDNLLKRCTLPEIEAVMGHEMGHYVMHHQFEGLVLNGLLVVIAFAFLHWGINASLARWGEGWGIRGMTDLAVVPLAVLLLAAFFFVATPLSNTITRTMEYEADIFGINASQQPDGEAEVDLKLGEYRKLDPGPIEEFLFFDHPSGRTRITAAMRWKAEHLPPVSPGSPR
jgi:STE24 endopeptidase